MPTTRVQGGTRRRSVKTPAAEPGVPALTAKPQTGAETVTVFTLDGNEYRAPAAVPYGVAIQYLRTSWRLKPRYAEIVLLERLLGADAVAALEQSTNLSKADYQEIVRKCTDIVLGSIEQEEESGN